MSVLKTYIVEDNPIIRENLIDALQEMLPVQVVGTATDENTAVEWLSEHRNDADLVIVDLFLEQGNGLGVLRAAQALHAQQAMVVLTNFATPDMSRKCHELGADRVFDKSNELDELLAYCGRLADGQTGHGDLGER